MNNRESIMAAVRAAQPTSIPLPQVNIHAEFNDNVLVFTEVLQRIGGTVVAVQNREAALKQLAQRNAEVKRIIIASKDAPLLGSADFDPHSLEDVSLAVIESDLGVAENGAIWVADAVLVQRVLPFITENLAVLLPKAALVSTMHDAYEKIGSADYGFGVFIAGPSKTADIEQSLVLGAHGSKSMTIFLLNE